MTNKLVDVKKNIQLLQLRGKIGTSKLCFLVDSGASANFISRSVLDRLKIDYDLVETQTVRLADGKMLKTCGSVTLNIHFGKFSYTSIFFVLQANIPTILGMQFLKSVSPTINWQKRVVTVGDVVLPCCRVQNQIHPDQQKCVDFSQELSDSSLHSRNSFELLRDSLDTDDTLGSKSVTPVDQVDDVERDLVNQ